MRSSRLLNGSGIFRNNNGFFYSVAGPRSIASVQCGTHAVGL